MDEKSQIRLKVRRLFTENRRQISELSNAIITKLEVDNDFIESQTIAIYWSLPDEVSTHKLITKWYKHKTILLPVIQGDILVLKKFEGQEKLVDGMKYHIPEPAGEIYTTYDKINLIITPGMAFDKENNRMGRGKGFYDRLLPDLKCKKIGICFGFQLFDKIPSEPHDIKVDKVIC